MRHFEESSCPKRKRNLRGSASLLLPNLYVLIGPFSQTSPSDAALVQTLDPMRFTQEIGTISAADLSGTAIANDIFLPPHVSQHTRFLMHTLPSGFVRIRYYGFLANRYRNERLDQSRRLLGVTSGPRPTFDEAQTPAENSEPSFSPMTCPACGRQSLAIIDVVPPTRPLPLRRPHFLVHRKVNSICFDTS